MTVLGTRAVGAAKHPDGPLVHLLIEVTTNKEGRKKGEPLIKTGCGLEGRGYFGRYPNYDAKGNMDGTWREDDGLRSTGFHSLITCPPCRQRSAGLAAYGTRSTGDEP